MTRGANVITLGCRANLAEAEALARWAGEGRTVVNSCAVTAEAVRDARKVAKQAIRQAGGQGGDVWVTGCAAATAPERFADLPVRIVEKPLWEGVGTLRSRGFVNIQDGCDHRCTFCITRLARGRARSAAADAIIARVRALVARGAVEIVLTGVDSASWGQDLPGRPPLSALVAAVLKAVPALPRLRLSTLDPAAIDDGLVALFAQTERLMPHVHLSLQSGDGLILKRMRRRHGPDLALKLVERLRAARPDLALGADVIAGFPTEAESAHQRTRDWLEAACVVHAHVFPFSPRPGTAAAHMPRISHEVARRRALELRLDAARRKEAWLQGQLHAEVEVVSEGDRGLTPGFADVRLPEPSPRGALLRVTPRAVRNGMLCP
ncbi:radical SAM protein [Thermaurantiacus sp.]